MDHSTSQTPRNGSTETEPLLPTHEQQSHTEDAASRVSSPGPAATSDEIRDFLTRLLILKRNLAPDHAHRIASKWTIGNGRELRSYPPAMYLDIFGCEDGWAVYKETKLCIANERGKKGSKSFWRHCVYMLVCLAALTAVVYAFFWGVQEYDQIVTGVSSIIFWPVFFFNVGCALSFSRSDDPETLIERDLQECVRKRGTHDS